MPRTRSTRMLPAAALAACLALPAAAQQYDPAPPARKATAADAFAATGRSEFYIATVHLDGRTGTAAQAGDAATFFPHPAEALPAAQPPAGGGLIVKGPSPGGDWQMRAFLFAPSQLVAVEGDTVVLTFVGVQGPSHRIAVEGHEGEIQLKRGETKSVVLDKVRPGIIRFASLDRLPSMVGQVVVLAKK